MGGRIGSRMEICEISGVPIAMVPHFYKRNVYITRKLRVWRTQKCIALVCGKTQPTCAGLQTSPFHGWYYRAENGIMRNIGPTNPHGTAFAQKQWVYQKEATGMESSKMCCPSRCRNTTYQCGAANFPVSWGAVQGLKWKYAKFRANVSAWYRVSTRGMLISKGSYGYGEPKNVLL